MNLPYFFSKHYWSDIFYNTKWGIKNLYTHFKLVWKSRPWDFNTSTLEMLRFKLEELATAIENGHEEEESRDNKVKNIRRCIVLLTNRIEDNYLDTLGGLNVSKYPMEFIPVDDKPEDHPAKCYTLKERGTVEERNEDTARLHLSIRMDNLEWDELWTIIKDTDARGWWD